MQENTEQLDDLTKESLISQLKEKIKENKTIQKKLDKLSEKYVQTYKEYKLLAKDRDTLFQAISFALNEEQFKFEQKQLGQFDVNQIIDQFKQKEEDRSRALTNLIKETNNEKFLLEERYRQMIEKQGQNSDQKTQQIIKQLRQQLSELDNNNTRLAKEIIELNDIIQIKNTQIQKMSQLEEDYANLKTQCMVSELQFQQPDRQVKINSADQMNEQLKMKQQIDRLLEEIQKQNQKIKQLEQQPQPQKTETPTAGFDYDEINPFEQDNGFQKQEIPQIIVHSQFTQTDFSPPEDNSVSSAANFEYLRNVVYKYFLYQETRNYKEASILMNAIMTILRMSNEERRRIDQARERGFLKSAKNLISDSFMCLKQPQLNDMNLERPNSRVELMNKHMMN